VSPAHPCDVLHTSRLLLRPFEAGDAFDVARMAGDSRLSDTLFELPRPYHVDDALAWIGSHAAERDKGRRHTFAICLRTDATLVGAIALRPVDRSSIRANLGYWTGVEHWSRGYASEAARAIIAFGFDAVGIERIEAIHLVRNPASGRVMRNAGMRREATLRAYVRDPHTGRIEDVEQWAVTRTGTAPASGARLLLARASSPGERAAIGKQGGGRVWLFLESHDFARDHARYVGAGVRFDEAPRHESYGTVAVFRDVCGNAWDLIEPKRR